MDITTIRPISEHVKNGTEGQKLKRCLQNYPHFPAKHEIIADRALKYVVALWKCFATVLHKTLTAM